MGLEKGRPELGFEPETATTRALFQAMDASPHLPDTAREAVNSIRDLLARRANRKLDETSSTMMGESIEDLMHELETQSQLIEEKNARIEQAERHNEHLRLTNDRMLALMERLAPNTLAIGALSSGRTPHEEEKDGTRPHAN